MYVAWRELRAARGRFALVGAVVALITLLVGFLTGLTGGLAAQSVSSVLDLPADRIVLTTEKGEEASLSRSAVSEQQATSIKQAGGVDSVRPVGISQLPATRGDQRTDVAMIGGDAGWWKVPQKAGTVAVSETAADDLGVRSGDQLELSGQKFTVDRVMPDQWYAHTPVVAGQIGDWRALDARTTGQAPYASALAASGDADWSALATKTDTTIQSKLSATTAVSSFRSEVGSLALIIGMLVAISALVVGAFFAVWGAQRRGDVAVLKALGASRKSILRDAVGQAVVVLIVGVATGLLLTVALGLLARTALPFVLNLATTLLPGLVVVLVGVVGAIFALRPVLKADPLDALGNAR